MDLADRIAARLEAKGLNPFAAARKAELKPDYVRDILRRKVKDPGSAKLAALAPVLGTSVAYLTGETDDPKPDTAPTAEAAEIELPILFKVAAGPFLRVDDLPQTPYGFASAPSIKGYEHIPQWYEQVEGQSFNKRIPPGALVHVADAIALRYRPRHGDVVIVTRTMAQGALIERSVKEVVITPEGIELWGRSYEEQYNRAISLTDGAAANNQDMTVQIAAKVIRALIRMD